MGFMFAKLLRSAFLLAVFSLTACGNHDKDNAKQAPIPITSYSVGGTLSGLSSGNSITLTNKGTDTLKLTADGTYTFPVKLANTALYELSLSQTTPESQTCISSNGSGMINAANVTDIVVTCGLLVPKDPESAGRVQFVNGKVSLTPLSGQVHKIKKGDALNEGDTLSSDQNASANFKMRDGGIIKMRPDTRFKIDNFKFNGIQDGSEQSFFSLDQGGFRAITGLIGKLHKQNYRISTPSGEIGIRGTDHEAYVVVANSESAKHSPVGTYDKVNSGQTTLTNNQGTVSIAPQQMGFIATPDKKPVLQPVDENLFKEEEKVTDKVTNPFDGRWSVKLVCDDTQAKGALVKGYSWQFESNIENGKLTGQYGKVGEPSSVTYVGQVQLDGTVDISAQGNTGNPDYTIGKVARDTPYSYKMTGKFSGNIGHVSRTTLRPCEATFAKITEGQSSDNRPLDASAGPSGILKQMPGNQALSYNQVVYVENDDRCNNGEVIKVTGGKKSLGIARKIECVKWTK